MAWEYDAVIVGGGLAGLSLAAHLAATPRAASRILIVDDGALDISRMGWGFWSTDPGWLHSAIASSWDSIAVHGSTGSRILPLHPYRYHAVRGDALAREVRARLAVAGGYDFLRGRAETVEDRDDAAAVSIDGRRVTAAWVFDSRPPADPGTGPALRFHGCSIEAGRDAFDPATMTFMDFRAGRPGRVRFGYVLPYTSRTALVEVAEIGWRPADDLPTSLDDYLQSVLGIRSWTVLGTEAGRMPLAPPTTPRAGRRVLSIGRRGGLLKPSTGYALGRIQRDSAAIARSLSERGHPFATGLPSRRHSWLDGVLLEVVRTRPDVIEKAFVRMFERNGAAAVLRFLDEDSGIGQEARLVASLPKAPFVRAALAGRPLDRNL